MEQQQRRRYGFLFRHGGSKSTARREQMPYQFPDVSTMTAEEVDAELKLRFTSMIRRGLIPTTETANLPENVVPLKPQQVTVPSQPQRRFTKFKPTSFIKRRPSEA